MSAPGQKLREAHEALVRAREALEEARLWFPVGGVAAPALLVLRDDVRTLATRVGTCAGEFYFSGWLTPADVDTNAWAAPIAPPRLSAECADEEPADLEDVEARAEDRRTYFDHPGGMAVADAFLLALAADTKARTVALVPPAVAVLPRCPKCHQLLGHLHVVPCAAVAETVADDKGERTGWDEPASPDDVWWECMTRNVDGQFLVRAVNVLEAATKFVANHPALRRERGGVVVNVRPSGSSAQWSARTITPPALANEKDGAR